MPELKRVLRSESLKSRVDRAIDMEEMFVFDVAAEKCQIFGNVSHLRSFKFWVAEHLIDEVKKWENAENPFA